MRVTRYPGFKRVAPPAAALAGQPDLAVAPGGTIYLSWIEPVDSVKRRLRVASLANGRWSVPTTVVESESLIANGADFPALLAPVEGRLVLAWPWRAPGSLHASHVRAAVSTDGGLRWTTPVTVHDDRSPTEHGFVSLAAEPGGARIVWLDGRAGVGKEEGEYDTALRSAFIDSLGRISGESQVDARVCDCCATSVAASFYGAVVAYRDRDLDEVRDVSIRRQIGPGWGTPQSQMTDGWRIQGCPVNGPAIDAIEERLFLAWYSAAADSPRVQAAFSVDGGATLAHRSRLDLGQALGRVDVVGVPGGDAIVTWLEGVDERARWLARRVSRDGLLGAPREIAAVPGRRSSGVMRVARSGERLIFAWVDPAARSRLQVGVAPLR
ncbi:MAG: exo-alpha-sialidase [Candidatus Eisenbacteria bacterium]|uniref:Exo-alpha-sialidase n=1 Tax=Eiseniibacteriota bacterium TaxID=2212470 RepID=A0A849SDI6_UNCEI|nr:exo-alpha-sialidase [Candidatus Eisenbacteria bacterium]